MKAFFEMCARVLMWLGGVGGFIWGLFLWHDSSLLMCVVNSLHLAAWLFAPGVLLLCALNSEGGTSRKASATHHKTHHKTDL